MQKKREKIERDKKLNKALETKKIDQELRIKYKSNYSEILAHENGVAYTLDDLLLNKPYPFKKIKVFFISQDDIIRLRKERFPEYAKKLEIEQSIKREMEIQAQLKQYEVEREKKQENELKAKRKETLTKLLEKRKKEEREKQSKITITDEDVFYDAISFEDEEKFYDSRQ